MASQITLSFETTQGTVTEISPDLTGIQPGQDLTHEERILDWMWYAYPQMSEPDPETGETTPLPRTTANMAKAVREALIPTWTGIKNNTLNWERKEAAQAARDGIPDLE